MEDLIKIQSLGVQPGGLAPPLKWAEGVAFNFTGMAPTREVVRETIEGKLHWSSVTWALMPQYKNVILIKDINAKIPVINVSDNSILCDVAKELMKKIKE